MPIAVECPDCDSSDVSQTYDFDCTLISLDCVVHDFKCDECGCLFIVEYAPINVERVSSGEPN